MAKEKTAFERIQIKNWYSYLNKLAWNEAVEFHTNEIKRLDGLRLKGRKGLSDKIRKQKQQLGTLQKNKTVKDPALQRFFLKAEEKYKKGLLRECYSRKELKHYRKAERSPEKFSLKPINDLFPLSASKFTNGPYEMFHVFKALNFRDALDKLLVSVELILKPSNQSTIDQLTAIKEDKAYPIDTRVSALAKEISNNIDHGNPHISEGAKAWVRLGIAYIQSRFLDNTHALAVCCFKDKSLQVIEKENGIPQSMWSEEITPDPEKVIEEFKLALVYAKKDNELSEAYGFDLDLVMGL